MSLFIIYIIGLPLKCTQEKEIIVQLSALNSHDVKLLHLQKLITALRDDPDLANIIPASHVILETDRYHTLQKTCYRI